MIKNFVKRVFASQPKVKSVGNAQVIPSNCTASARKISSVRRR